MRYTINIRRSSNVKDKLENNNSSSTIKMLLSPTDPHQIITLLCDLFLQLTQIFFADQLTVSQKVESVQKQQPFCDLLVITVIRFKYSSHQFPVDSSVEVVNVYQRPKYRLVKDHFIITSTLSKRHRKLHNPIVVNLLTYSIAWYCSV